MMKLPIECYERMWKKVCNESAINQSYYKYYKYIYQAPMSELNRIRSKIPKSIITDPSSIWKF